MEKTVSILALIVAICSLYVAYSTLLVMTEIHEIQYEAAVKQVRINNALNNGDLEFSRNEWEEAFRHYNYARTLGSTDRRGHINFRNRAYARKIELGRYHPIVVQAFYFANRLY